ncbi:hypothetical protein BFN03_07105 [Rhodococcus sp. WMMA185]|nr:hypothetical protein BFN03_07105 [Rhodococcus sp. WMMA185]
MGSAVAGALADVAEQYRGAAGIVDGARSHLVSVVSDARGRGFNVEDDGWVDPAGLIAWLVLAPEHTRDAARLRIEKEAAELTLVVVDALRQARDAAVDAANRIQGAIDALQQAGQAAVPGNVVDHGDGGFTMVPDWPSTIAASTIGVMTDKTGKALESAAKASAAAYTDDVARNIGRGLGPLGAVVGTVPAIVNDIKGGMDPTKAIVSESAGSAVGLGVGMGLSSVASYAVAGSALGSVVPGAGTAAGLVVGAAFGALATWGVSKGIQAAWD